MSSTLMRMGKNSSFLIASAFLIFLVVLLPGTRHYLYYHDEFTLIKECRLLATDPQSSWAPNYHFRTHPLYKHFLYLENFFFGLNPLPYFLVLFCLHFFNSLLVTRLCGFLGGSTLAQTLSGLFFLCSSSSFQVLIAVHETIRVFCLFLFLLGLFSWIEFLAEGRWFPFLKTAFFQTMSLLVMEDAMIFPLLIFFLGWRIAPRSGQRKRGWLGPLLILLALDLLILCPLVWEFLASPYRVTRVSFGAPLGAKLISLLEMFVRHLFVPEKGLLGTGCLHENLLRLVPLFFLAVLSAIFFLRGERLRYLLDKICLPAVLTACGWIAITTLPFLLHAMTFEHASRLLYFPMVGFSMVCGVIAAAFFETAQYFASRRGIVSFFAALFYVLGLNLANTHYQYHKLQHYLAGRVDEGYNSLQESLQDTDHGGC